MLLRSELPSQLEGLQWPERLGEPKLQPVPLPSRLKADRMACHAELQGEMPYSAYPSVTHL